MTDIRAACAEQVFDYLVIDCLLLHNQGILCVGVEIEAIVFEVIRMISSVVASSISITSTFFA